MSQTELILAESLLAEGDLAGARELVAKVMAGTEHLEAARKLLAELEAAEERLVGSSLPLAVSVEERARQGAEVVEGAEEEERSGGVVPPPDAGRSATSEETAEDAQLEMATPTAGEELIATEPDVSPAPTLVEPSPAPAAVEPTATESGELPDLSTHGAKIDQRLAAVSAALDHGDVAQALRKVEPVLRLFGDARLADEIVAAVGPDVPAEAPRPPVGRRRWLIAAAGLVLMLVSLAIFWATDDETPPPEPEEVGATFENAPPSDEEANVDARPQEAADSTDPSEPIEDLAILDEEDDPPQDEPREPALGTLIVDASPWARVASIRRTDGSPAPRGDCHFTPCQLHLVVGTYRIELVHEELPARTITATVAGGRTQIATVKLTDFSAEDFLVAATVE